jgi:hypothetical protein
LFSPDNGFEKESERGSKEFLVGSYGRIGIEEKLPPDRDHSGFVG